MEQLPTPHNNFFQFALAHLPNARSLIESQLSPAALAELDLDTLQLESRSFIDADLRERFSDLLISVRLAGAGSETEADRALVYLLFEHKSQSDPLTVFQLLAYIVRIWEKRLRDGLPLCPVVPLVIYHGERSWTGARSLAELVRAPSGLDEYQVGFRFPLLDLSQLTDEEIAGEPLLRSTLRLLKYSRSDRLPRMLGEILQLIAQSLPESRLPQWLQAVGVYIMSVNKDMDAPQYKQTLKSVFPTQFEPGSLADRLLTQGLEQGREEGREEGKLAGKIQTFQELLGDPVSTDDELLSRDRESLLAELAGLQARLRRRDT
jgi:predicted transposase/invertase (TIGR01784 family)